MSDELKIERGVPIPEIGNRGRRWPWADMKHGDSILVPLDGRQVVTVRNAAVANGRNYLAAHRPGWKVVTRRESDAIRLWLIDPAQGNNASAKKPGRKRRSS